MNELNELRKCRYGSFSDIFAKMREIQERYANLPAESVASAVSSVMPGTSSMQVYRDPYVQNRRVKAIQTLPHEYSKDQVSEMIVNPDSNEQQIREVSHALEYTAYPMLHMRRVYQDMATYHSYIMPDLTDDEDVGKKDFMREWKLLEKFRKEMNPKAKAHEVAGQAILEGKVFYTVHYSLDKPRNKVRYAYMQQLPSDWCKIVGFNNKTKYTIAFNMMYFMQPGASVDQFGDLFAPYFRDFNDVVSRKESKDIRLFSSDGGLTVDMEKVRWLRERVGMNGDPNIYAENGRYFYWVTLPVDKVFTFEADDVPRTATSPFTGMFLSMLQLAQYEQIQLELVQNPLISIVTGEIPYKETKETTEDDQYMLSNAGREMFEAFWYNMLADTNTSGIGIYFAPVKNMAMHQLAEAPGATEISSNGYSYSISKAGLSALIPSATDTRAGAAQISLQIESKFTEPVYRGFERMFTVLFESMNLKYDWQFKMFGNIAEDKDMMENCRKDMTLGILPQAIIYNALLDRSILDDICLSKALQKSGIMDMRLPLVSTYSAKQSEGGLPPRGNSPAGESAAHDMNPGGRPASEGQATSDGQEGDLDTVGG